MFNFKDYIIQDPYMISDILGIATFSMHNVTNDETS